MTKYQSGDKYGYMTLTGKSFMIPNGCGQDVRYVEVICRCSKVFFVILTAIKNGYTKSCGCYGLEKRITFNTKHGMVLNGITHPIYKAWIGMRSRCNGSGKSAYKNYFLRGILVCKEWKDNFNTFYKWAIENGWEKGLSLDRKDNNGNYEPTNCRWTTRVIQQRNRRSNVMLTAFGETKCLNEWVEDIRCTSNSSTAIKYRLKMNCSPEEAISRKKGVHI